MKKNVWLGLYTFLIYLFLYTPILILILYSFNTARFSVHWHGATLAWYRELFKDSDLWLSVSHSMFIGIAAASLASIIGLFGAYCLYRYRFLGKKLLHGLVFVLIITPDVVMGISLLVLFSAFNIPLGFMSLMIAHITFCLPFVVVCVYSRLVQLDKNLFEAAKDLGASEITIFHRIIIPLVWPALLSAWLLSFTLSFDDILISYFVSGPGYQILPLAIYEMVRHGVTPEINALCTMTFGLTLLLTVIAQLALRRKS